MAELVRLTFREPPFGPQTAATYVNARYVAHVYAPDPFGHADVVMCYGQTIEVSESVTEVVALLAGVVV